MNFQGWFESINDVFWNFWCLGNNDNHGIPLRLVKFFSSRLEIFDNVLSAPNEYRMKKLRPLEVGVSTNPIGDHKPFGVSYPGVGVLDV
jgi:hypothetical protein